jgi:hypothetical protein
MCQITCNHASHIRKQRGKSRPKGSVSRTQVARHVSTEATIAREMGDRLLTPSQAFQSNEPGRKPSVPMRGRSENKSSGSLHRSLVSLPKLHTRLTGIVRLRLICKVRGPSVGVESSRLYWFCLLGFTLRRIGHGYYWRRQKQTHAIATLQSHCKGMQRVSFLEVTGRG